MYTPPSYVFPTPIVLSHGSLFGALNVSNYLTGGAASRTGNAANMAIYAPIVTTERETWGYGFWWNGSVATNAGNVSVGVYDTAGTQLATTGNVAASGNSVVQAAVFTASVVLNPGSYYVGWMLTTGAGLNAIFGYAASLEFTELGVLQQAVGSNPLPATATFATWSSQVLPIFGISRASFAI